ncbi:MAG: membrane protein insertion efficiency factor YidD [Legionellales bacterium]|nr:membrane protein insertion efficiency factor YidD [Legionellales bacterium]
MASISQTIKRLLIAIIRGYQQMISPWLSPCCRFVPSCSEYACQCLRRRPLPEALFHIVYRIARCNPFTRGGLDTRGLGYTKE